MKMLYAAILVAAISLSACTASGPILLDSTPSAQAEMAFVEPVFTGQSESLEFVLVDDVFLIDRNFSIFFVALFLYLPFFII
jgi:hypothetical protein